MYWGQEGLEVGGSKRLWAPSRCWHRRVGTGYVLLMTACVRGVPSFVFSKFTLKGFIKSFVQMAQDHISLLTLCSWVL